MSLDQREPHRVQAGERLVSLHVVHEHDGAGALQVRHEVTAVIRMRYAFQAASRTTVSFQATYCTDC